MSADALGFGSLARIIQVPASLIASPHPEMLQDRSAIYQLNVAPFTRYVSNGASLDQLQVGNRGISTQSGNGVATVFTIAHGLSAAPTFFSVTGLTPAAQAASTVTVDATNNGQGSIIVTPAPWDGKVLTLQGAA